MDKLKKDLLVGIIVILVGVILLLINLELININISGPFIASFIFFAGFLFFIVLYIGQKRKEFWPIIPAFILLGLSLLIASSEYNVSGQFGAGLFILFIGLSFIMVYLLHRQNWWAVIPGGMIASVSLVIFVGSVLGVGLMFLGMGATFYALYPLLQKISPTNNWWTFIPGSILGIMGLLFIIFGEIQIGEYVLPIALILIGGILIYKSYKKNES